MKKLLLILCLITAAAGVTHAQISKIKPSYLPDENAVVKDSAGRQFNYDDWSFMVQNGKFSLKPRNSKGEYIIYPLFDANSHRIITDAMKNRRPAESEQFHAGDIFKPFNGKDMNGEKFDLKKMAGKVFVINFWFIGCPPCRAEIPDLNNIVEHYKDNKDVVFIALCLDKGYSIQNFIKQLPFNYHIIDDARSVADKYGVHLYPTNLVVNRDGKVVYSSVGGVPANVYWIPKTIDEALKAPISTVQ